MSASHSRFQQLAQDIKSWGKALGFQQVGIADIDVNAHRDKLEKWLQAGYQGTMSYLENNVEKRLAPEKLHPETLRVISVRMDYLPPDAKFAESLKNKHKANISRYAVGRDYHKLLRNRLKKLGEKIQSEIPDCTFRPFVDSAPVLEHALAEKAGIGWTGKHSLTLNESAGSWFFLGELFISLPLPTDKPVQEKCGSCTACITICPTQAIVEPYVVDARRCISYLTIEHKGTIPIEFRKAIGNRIYGCDDCQLICPWNRYAQLTKEEDFFPRHRFTDINLLELFAWTEQEFLDNTAGSAIRRIGYLQWRRNIVVALGNAPYDSAIVEALRASRAGAEELLQEHIDWSIAEQENKQSASLENEAAAQRRLNERLIRSIEKGLPRDA